MTDYGATIQLYDKMTPVLNTIMNAMNMSVGYFYDMQSAMSQDIETEGFENYRQAVADASEELAAFRERRNNIPEPNIGSWTGSNFQVFTNTGADRFLSETQSAFSLLSQIQQKQSEIAAKAQNSSVFPDNAKNDINSIGERITQIGNKLSLIEQNQANPLDPNSLSEIENLRQQMSQIIDCQNQMNTAVEKLDVSRANALYLQLNSKINQTEQYLRDNVNAQGQFNSKIDQGVASADNFGGALGRIASAAAAAFSIKSVIELADSMTQTEARLSLITGDLEKTAKLQDQIVDSANRSRSAYQTTVDAVSKMGIMARDAFNNTDELVVFTELINKQFTIAGTSPAGQEAAMLQLTQAMASGVLRGEELNSIFEQAPTIIQTIADYLGVPIGKIRDMASEGQITSDVVKNAMLASADDINNKFESMPYTFSQVWTMIQNNLLEAFNPIIQAIGSAAQWINDNWADIKPVLLGIAIAAGILAAAWAINTAVTWLQVSANRALVVSLLKNPIVGIAVIIGFIVAAIYKWIQAVGGIKNAWELFKIKITAIWYSIQLVFYKGVYGLLKLFDELQFKWNSACVAIANYLGDLKVSVLTILQNMVNGAIDIINDFISVINNIPGVSIEAIEHVTFAATAEAENEAAKQDRANQLSEYQKKLAEIDFERTTKLNQLEAKRDALRLEYYMLNKTYRKQAETEENAEYLGEIEENISEINDTIQASSDEELEYLRKIAEREAVNKYTTAEIKLDFTSNANIKSDMDIDGMINSFTDELQRTLVTTASALER